MEIQQIGPRGLHLCEVLAELDQGQYKEICVDTGLRTALERALVASGYVPGENTYSAFRPAAAPAPGPGHDLAGSGAFVELNQAARTRLASSVVEELRHLGSRLGQAAEYGAWVAIIQIEAEAQTLRDDIAASLTPEAVKELPEEPLALLPPANLASLLAELKRRSQESKLAALAGDIGAKRTIPSLEEQVALIEAAAAKGGIASSHLKELDTERFYALSQNRAARIALAREAKTRELVAKAPNIMPAPPPPATGPPEGRAAFESIVLMQSDPARAILQETSVRVAFADASGGSSNEQALRKFRIQLLDPASQALLLKHLYDLDHAPATSIANQSDRRANKDILVAIANDPSRAPFNPPPPKKKAPDAPQSPGGSGPDNPKNSGRGISNGGQLPAHPNAGQVAALPPTLVDMTLSEPARQYHFLTVVEERYPQGGAPIPSAIQEWVKIIMNTAINSDTEALDAYAKRLFGAESRALQHLPQALPANLIAARANARAALRDAARSLLDRVDFTAEAYALKVGDRAALEMILVRLGGDPFDARPSAQSTQPIAPRGPPLSLRRIAAASVGLSTKRAFADTVDALHPLEIASGANAESDIKQLEKVLKLKPSRSVASINRGKAWAVREDDLISRIDPAKLWRVDAKRLPETLSRDWDTFRRPRPGSSDVLNGDVHPYSDVLTPKNFRAIGGGIHFGATLATPKDLRDFVLRYDRKSGRLAFVGHSRGQNGLVVMDVLDERIAPSDIKALLRFARSGFNLAISIGWVGENDRPPISENKAEKGLTPIYLDREFVDTRVGQDLIVADSIPWNLGDQKLGAATGPNPIAPQVCQALTRLQFNREEERERLKTTIVNWITDAPQMDDTGRGPLLDIELARLENEGSELDDATARLVAGLLAENASFRDSFREATRAAFNSFRQVPSYSEYVAETLLDRVPNIELAVLRDVKWTLSFSQGAANLKGRMNILYVDNQRNVRDKAILFHAEGAPDEITRTIEPLTMVVNKEGLEPGLLQRVVPALGRVEQYAGLVALLRWAEAAVREERLAGLDLGDLTDVASYDAVRTPTPDRLARNKRKDTCPA